MPSAILRIQKELENSDPGKVRHLVSEEIICSPQISQLVWFLTPTIALAEQQHGVVCQQLPAYQCRLLSGNDNVSHWSSQGVWDGILNNINIVVSTPQVLLDALSSGFVKLARISLLVVDEGKCFLLQILSYNHTKSLPSPQMYEGKPDKPHYALLSSGPPIWPEYKAAKNTWVDCEPCYET